MQEIQNPEKCIKDLIPAYKNKASEIDKLIGKLAKKGQDLWWDSKTAEKDKVKLGWKWSIFKVPFKNISYFTELNKCTVVKAVTELYLLYDKIGGVTQEIDKVMSEQGINVAEPKINSLIFYLKECIEKAKKEKHETQSSTVYNLNKELIAVQSQVVSNLQAVIWEASQKRNLHAVNQLEKGVDLNQECRKLHEEYEKRNKELEVEKQALQEKNQALEEEKQEAEKKSQEAEKKNQELTQKLEALTEKVATVMQHVTIEGAELRGLDNARGNNTISH